MSERVARTEALLDKRKGRRKDDRVGGACTARPRPASIGSRGGMSGWKSVVYLVVDTPWRTIRRFSRPQERKHRSRLCKRKERAAVVVVGARTYQSARDPDYRTPRSQIKEQRHCALEAEGIEAEGTLL